jgi:hypothetical protein
MNDKIQPTHLEREAYVYVRPCQESLGLSATCGSWEYFEVYDGIAQDDSHSRSFRKSSDR